ncbi:MAG: alpha-beta hydrolase superfamily lysophospholipase [Oceanicoccus sp.]|jgi:alpha-beta hydrolase superfamily lysophospholipase
MPAMNESGVKMNWTPEQVQGQIPPLSIDLLGADMPETINVYNQYYGLDLESKFIGLQHIVGSFNAAEFTISGHVFVLPQAKGTVLLVHGYYDHVGLYHHIIEHCLSQGYSVFSYDLPGHGLSSGERAAIQSFRQYDDVFCAALNWVQKELPSPLVVIGQSTGGAVIINYLLSRSINKTNNPFANVFLMAPLVRPVDWTISKLFFYLAKPFVKQLKRQFAQNSHNLDFLSFISTSDPLQPLFLKTNWVGALKKWIRFIEASTPVDLEIHVIQGTQDGTVDYRHNMLVLEEKFSGFDVTFVEQGRHHLANEEPIKLQQVLAAMTPLI